MQQGMEELIHIEGVELGLYRLVGGGRNMPALSGRG